MSLGTFVFKFWWAERDSNPRRREPSGLQPDPVDHFGIYPNTVSCMQYFVFCIKNTSYKILHTKYTFEPLTGLEPITYCLQNSCSTN